MSKSHLLKLFKQYYKISPIKYQMTVRLEKSKQMLEYTRKNISEISNYLGFADIQHFSKVFKQHTGMNPSAYREKFMQSVH